MFVCGSTVFKNGKLTSLLITYVRMKDNWHGSIERYMLNEDDLRIYSLLFGRWSIRSIAWRQTTRFI